MAPLSSESVIAFENVSHRFGSFEALRGLTLSIHRGDIYGLLGLNGAGKTTSIRILLGLLRHRSGKVELFGQRRSTGWLSLCDKIGATIESPAFYPHLTGFTNLELLNRLSHRRKGRSPKEILEMVGIAEAADVKVRKYSMGMLQRLYIGQALLSNPEILVLDEPTSNLDPQGILDVRNLIKRLNRDEGVTILLSSHQLSEVEDVCNRVAIINRGRRIVESTVAELFNTEECWVEVHADRPDEANKFISGLDWCSETMSENGVLRTRLVRSRRGELNTLLVKEGFSVTEFTERRSTLEEYFHQKVAEDVA